MVAKEYDFEPINQADPQWIQEAGIYQDACPFNFREDDFMEKMTNNINKVRYEKNKKEGETELWYVSRTWKNHVTEYGVADSIEQIKEFYKKQIAHKKDKYIISVTPVWQEKENKGKGGGWRWHKWGKYIGKLNPQYEYLDDENFGDDFCGYVLVFNLYYVY